MAVTFETSGKMERGSSYWLDTGDIDIDAENNGRHVLPDISWLVESIKTEGQRIPCLIRKNGARAMMVEGHSRWRAICQINRDRKPEERLKVWCVYFQGNEVDALQAGFEANRERNALTPVDEGYFVSRMIKFGKTLKQIAEICHEDEAWCKQRALLVQLTPEAQKRVASDPKMKITAAVALAQLASAEQKRLLASGEKLTASAIKRAAHPPVDGDSDGEPRWVKPTLKKVYDIVHDIAAHDNYPKGLTENCTKERLVEWLDEFISGEPPIADELKEK